MAKEIRGVLSRELPQDKIQHKGLSMQISNTTWTKIVDDGSDYIAQNNGNDFVLLGISATPTETVKLYPNQVITQSVLAGEIYAKAKVNGTQLNVHTA